MPKRSSWLWGDSEDRSKSKCMCVLVDTQLTAASTPDSEPQMCSYTPIEVDTRAVESSQGLAEESDQFTAASQGDYK